MRAAPQSAHWRCAEFLAPFQGAKNSRELDPGAARPAVACTWLPSACASGAETPNVSSRQLPMNRWAIFIRRLLRLLRKALSLAKRLPPGVNLPAVHNVLIFKH